MRDYTTLSGRMTSISSFHPFPLSFLTVRTAGASLEHGADRPDHPRHDREGRRRARLPHRRPGLDAALPAGGRTSHRICLFGCAKWRFCRSGLLVRGIINSLSALHTCMWVSGVVFVRSTTRARKPCYHLVRHQVLADRQPSAVRKAFRHLGPEAPLLGRRITRQHSSTTRSCPLVRSDICACSSDQAKSQAWDHSTTECAFFAAQIAARLGSARAHTAAGQMLCEGRGVACDLAAAISWSETPSPLLPPHGDKYS